MNIFSQRLKEERLARGYTQRKMAEILQISQGTYKGYELVGEVNGREPSLDMLKKLSLALDTKVDYLLGLED